MSELPEPPVPADLDLRDFRWMKLDIIALFNSDFNATPDDTAWRAGVTLWGKAWHQVPAGSLPNDDPTLCNLAGLGRDLRTWRRIREVALRGFELCSDGRLYHGYVCKMALDADAERRRFEERRERDRSRKKGGNSADVPEETQQVSERIPPEPKSSSSGIPVENAVEGEGQGEGEGKRKGKKGASASSPKLSLERTFPPWWPERAWKAYVEMRRKARKPLTDLAIERAIREVGKLRDAGHDPGAVVEQSACKCWTDFYAPKDAPAQQNTSGPGAPARYSDGWWEGKLALHKERGVWLAPDGPPPTDADCNVPYVLLVKHGYREARQ